MLEVQQATQLDTLLDLAGRGLWPLFDQGWIIESTQDKDSRRLSLGMANRIVKEGMKRLERHTSLDRKKTALGAFSERERKVFIQSFVKMVEYKALDITKEFH